MLVKCSDLSLYATHKLFFRLHNQKTLPKFLSSSGQGGKAAPNFGDSPLHKWIHTPAPNSAGATRTQMQPHSGYQHNPQHPPTMGLRTNVYFPAGICTTTEKKLQLTNMCSNLLPWIKQKCKETPGPCEMNVYYTRPSFMTVHIKRV